MIPPRGILWEGKSPVDGGPIVAIATDGTKNRKTGDMVQVWIMRSDLRPDAAARLGLDASVCGDCRHRGDGVKRSCYVTLVQAPLSIFRTFTAGGYSHVPLSALRGERIRWGAYGDPGMLPFPLVAEVCAGARGWTGYTHQWRNLPSYWSRYLMASTDTTREQNEARAAGWRTFRVRPHGTNETRDEISCPATPEGGGRSQCERCLLCSGTGLHARNAPSISVYGHGPLAGTRASV